MAIDSVMRAIVQYWDSVEHHLTVADGQRLRALLERYSVGGATTEDQLDAIEEMAEMLSLALPDDHPVRRAIADSGIVRSAGTLELDEELIAELRRILDEAAAIPRAAPDGHDRGRAAPGAGQAVPDAGHTGALLPAEIEREATARLAAAPALSAADLRSRGGDPGQQHLIRFDSRDGPRFPLFQFDSAGRPYPLVLSINALLDADADPWGVADWWLGPHAWLDRPPAESIGEVADHVLLATAQAMVEAG